MLERSGVITFQGSPLTLLGREPTVGEPAPEFYALDTSLNSIYLSSLSGKVRVICSVPSLDTPVCDMEAKRFNEEATKMGPDIEVILISMDLPFAQKRWCSVSGADRVRTLSDHRDANFGTSYGTLIKELRLLTRAVFIVDSKGILRYSQWVKEITREPDYDEILGVLKEIR